MKCNKNTNFRIRLYFMCTWICALGRCRGSTNWKFTGSPKKLCFHWYSLKGHHPQNVQKQQKSDFSFVAKQLKWDQRETHTHTHSQQSPAVLPVRPSSLTRLSPVFHPSTLLRLLSSVYSVTVTTSCPVSGTGRVGAPVLLQDIQLPLQFRGRAALWTVCYESVQNKYTQKTTILTFTPTNMKSNHQSKMFWIGIKNTKTWVTQKVLQ